MTVLEIINEAQKRLRLPQSISITDPHAKLSLSFINDVMCNYMTENAVWDALKIYGNFTTTAGYSIYTILEPAGELDSIRNLQIGTNDPLVPYSDVNFLAYKRVNPGQGMPKVYRIRSRVVGSLLIEVAPTPDQTYTVDVEALKKPPKLVNGTDTPLLDADTILLGLIMLLQKDKGLDYSDEAAAFKMKMDDRSSAEGGTDFGDLEGV